MVDIFLVLHRVDIIVEFDRSLLQHFDVGEWNAFVNDLMTANLIPPMWSPGDPFLPRAQTEPAASTGFTTVGDGRIVGGSLQSDHTCGTGRRGIVSINWTVLPTAKTSDESAKTGVPDSDWLETEEVAKYLQLTPKTVREGAARGSLPGHKYPARSTRGRWRFKKDELDKFLKKPAPHRHLPQESIWN